MRLSDGSIAKLRELLRAEYGLEYDSEQTQEAGLAVMRFFLAKRIREEEPKNREDEAKSTQTAELVV